MLAVVEQRPPQRVTAVSPDALSRGICPGVRLAGARAIAPDLEIRYRDPALEHDTLQEFATWAGRFSPAVCIDPPDGILLEVEGCLRLFGGLSRLATQLAMQAADLGLNVRLAAAPTPLAARWLAETSPGTLVNPAPGWSRCLEPLPLHLLARDPAVSNAAFELLQGIGVRSIGEAARLPRDGLARRRSAEIHDTLDRAWGKSPDPRPWHTPPDRFDARLVLPAAVDTIEPLLFATRRLVTSLTAWLDGLHAVVDRCRLHLEHEAHPATVLDVVTGEPGRSEERFILLMREHLAALRRVRPVQVLRLTAEDPILRASGTADLFGDPAQTRENAILLLARLRARLGSTSVRGICPWPEHRPEQAWREADPGILTSSPRARMPNRPIWLLSEPRPLPSVEHLTLLAGPERIESGWWDSGDIRRDYFVARTHDAALWWIFRRLDQPGDWYVHGYFG